MSLATNLLNSLESTSVQDASPISQDEEHIVVDETRRITVPRNLQIIAVTGDKDIETVTFDCVRFWDENDLSTFAIYLNYVLPDLTTGTYIPDVISTSDGDNFYHFDWKIKNTITQKSGKISFAITAIKTKQNESGETVVDKQWSSLPTTDCSIAVGLDISNVPEEEENSGIIAQLSAILEKIQGDLDEWVKNNVVQSTGSSTTKVMSQDATTREISLAEQRANSYTNEKNSELSRKVEDNRDLTIKTAKRVKNIEMGIAPDPFFTDDSIAYQKIVPENALPYAEISKIGGMSHRDTATNTLKDAKVTEVKSIGANMIPYPFAFSSNTVRGVTFKANSDGSIYVNGKATANASQFVKKLESLPKGTYCLSGTKGGVSVYLQFWNGGTWVKEIWVNGSFTVDYSNYTAIDVVAYVASGTSVNTTIYPMINPGSTALPFAPYKRDTIAIPSEVQALEGYSLGVDASYCNHIAWGENGGKKTYHQMVHKRVFDGTESGWSVVDTNGGGKRFQFYNATNKPLVVDVAKTSPLVCSHLPAKSANETWDNQDGASMQGEMFYIKDARYTMLDTWKAYLAAQHSAGNPFTIVYALNSPTETDIFDLITSDNMLEVEGGGIIVAENENKMGAATTVTYQLKEDA